MRTRGAQPRELRGGQRHGARRPAMRAVAVEIRSPGQQKIELACNLDVFVRDGTVMVGMKRLDGVEAGFDKRGNTGCQAKLTRMRERRDTASLMDRIDDRLG